MEGIWKFLKSRSLVSDIKFGNNILFAVAMALISFYYHLKGSCIKESYFFVFKQLFGKN